MCTVFAFLAKSFTFNRFALFHAFPSSFALSKCGQGSPSFILVHLQPFAVSFSQLPQCVFVQYRAYPNLHFWAQSVFSFFIGVIFLTFFMLLPPLDFLALPVSYSFKLELCALVLSFARIHYAPAIVTLTLTVFYIFIRRGVFDYHSPAAFFAFQSVTLLALSSRVLNLCSFSHLRWQ
jgi:hypothetical protein